MTKTVTYARYNHLRTLMKRGRLEEAGQKCIEWGIDIEDIKVDPYHEVPAALKKPVTPDLEDVMKPKDPASPIPTSPDTPAAPIQSKWPVETDVVVLGQPVNQRLVVVRLPDQRTASLWKRGGRFPNKCMVRARLCDQVGPDAYYEPVTT